MQAGPGGIASQFSYALTAFAKRAGNMLGHYWSNRRRTRQCRFAFAFSFLPKPPAHLTRSFVSSCHPCSPFSRLFTGVEKGTQIIHIKSQFNYLTS